MAIECFICNANFAYNKYIYFQSHFLLLEAQEKISNDKEGHLQVLNTLFRSVY